jgi:hypothetical protein
MFTVHAIDNSEGFDLRQGAVPFGFLKKEVPVLNPFKASHSLFPPFMGFEEVNLCHSLE